MEEKRAVKIGRGICNSTKFKCICKFYNSVKEILMYRSLWNPLQKVANAVKVQMRAHIYNIKGGLVKFMILEPSFKGGMIFGQLIWKVHWKQYCESIKEQMYRY